MIKASDLITEVDTYIDLEKFKRDDLVKFQVADVNILPVVLNNKYIGALSLFDVAGVNKFEGAWYSEVIKQIDVMTLEEEIPQCFKCDLGIIPILDNAGLYKGFVKRENLIQALEVKKCENLLDSYKKMESKFETILDSSKDGIHVTDGECVTVFYNKACERIENLAREEIIGKRMEEIIESGQYTESVALKVKEERKSISMIQKVQGKEILATGTPIFENEKITNIVVNSRDITELNDLRRKLKTANTVNEEYKTVLGRLGKKQLDGFIAKSHVMKQVVELSLRVSKVDSTILIEGESGVGKGVISNLIHKNSNRVDKAFMKIDCGVIPEQLLESELFGYEKGSFTGANDSGKIGLVELADEGTLFLDEIGELPLQLQAKLLRVLQDREFMRVGGKKVIPVNIRIIAATNKDLKSLVTNGKFREDLYYRLNVIPIHIRPLRERKEDILPLIESILNRINDRLNMNKVFSPDVLKLMLNYDWPGNVRELENIVERVVVVSLSDVIIVDDLPESVREYTISKQNPLDGYMSYKDRLEQFEKQLMLHVKNQSVDTMDMANKLNIDRSTIRRKMKKHQISIEFK